VNVPLPLGIDIGATRIRIVEAHLTPSGPRVRAIAVREFDAGCAGSGTIAEPSYVSAMIEDALSELKTKERRCVCALGEPDALLRSVAFPKMTASERERSARFEAQRYAAFPLEQAIVRIHRVDRAANVWALGIARSAAIATRVRCLKDALWHARCRATTPSSISGTSARICMCSPARRPRHCRRSTAEQT
jgi:Tfp pilus assembly PilM family ATPase